MPYVNQCFCTYCAEPLNNYQVKHSEGRCPYCGIKGEKASTIIDHYDEARYVGEKPIIKACLIIIAILVVIIPLLIWSK